MRKVELFLFLSPATICSFLISRMNANTSVTKTASLLVYPSPKRMSSSRSTCLLTLGLVRKPST